MKEGLRGWESRNTHAPAGKESVVGTLTHSALAVRTVLRAAKQEALGGEGPAVGRGLKRLEVGGRTPQDRCNPEDREGSC